MYCAEEKPYESDACTFVSLDSSASNTVTINDSSSIIFLLLRLLAVLHVVFSILRLLGYFARFVEPTSSVVADCLVR